MRGPRIFFCYRASSDPGIIRFLRQLVADMQMMGAEVVIDDSDEAHADLVLLRHEISRCEKMLVVQTPEAIDSFQVNAAIGIALELNAQGPMHGILRLIVTPLAPNNLPWMWDILKSINITVNYAQARDELLLALGFTSPESWADTQPSRSIALSAPDYSPKPFVLPVSPANAAPTSAQTITMATQVTPQPQSITPSSVPAFVPPALPQRRRTLSFVPPVSPLHRRIQLRYAVLAACIVLILSSVAGIAAAFAHVQTSEYLAATATAGARRQMATAQAQMSVTTRHFITQTAQAQATMTAVAQRNATATAIAAATATVQAYQPQVYEAESPVNALSGGARVENCGRCSGGEKVGYVGHGGVLQFRNVMVSYNGDFTLTLYYGTPNNRQADISVNGAAPIVLNFPSTGGLSNIGQQSVVIPLHAGANVITIYNNNNWAPDFDKILV